MTSAAPQQHFASQYDNAARTAELIQAGKHRALIGGMWEEIGQLQFDFLIQAGLSPENRVLDLGCGCLRLGVKLVPYLEPGHYYGVDAEKKLLDAGFRKEIVKVGAQDRLERRNLYCSRLFLHERLPEGTIDFGMCCSVMTHLPLNFLRVCLENAGRYFKPGGKLFLSFFELPEGARFSERHTNAKGITTTGHADPYHYYREDMIRPAAGAGWSARHVGEWEHPRGQVMMEYVRI